MVFREMTPCSLIGTNISEKNAVFISYPEDGGNRFDENTGNSILEYMVSHPRRSQS
jgi:hypothetical protein